MSVDKRESRVVVTQRQVTQVVSSGVQGPAGGLWTNWDEIPDKPSTYPPSAHNHDTAYDPLGAAAAAQAAAITAAALDATGKIDALKDGVAADGDTLAKLRALIQGIQTLLTSDNINLDTLQEVVDFVELHQSDLEALGATKVNISDIINVLTDTSSNKPLSAAQGKVLKDALDALTAVVGGKEPTIAAGTTSQYWRGDKSWRDFATDVRAAVLTGLSTATSTVVAAADSVLVAIGKLQAQITGHTGNTSNPHSTTAAQVGADPAGTAASSMSGHVAAADPHTQYALESSLGDAAGKNTGTTAGTVAAGDDARLTNSREWTASTVDQPEAEAGTATTRRAWTAQRVRQAIAAWWNTITNIDGKNIGATTAGTGRFTTLTTTGNAGFGGSSTTRVGVTIASGADGVNLAPEVSTPVSSARLFFSSTSGGWSIFNADGRLRFNHGATAGVSSGSELVGLTPAGLSVTGNLTATGGATIGGSAPLATIAGTTLYPSTTPFVEVRTASGDAPQDTLMVLRQYGISVNAHKKRVGVLFKHSSEGTTSESTKMTGIWSETVSSYSNTPELVVGVGDAERARFTPAGLSVTGNLTATGNTTLGDASSDTVTVNGVIGVGGAALTYAGLFVQNSALSGTSQTGVISVPVASSAATVRAVGYQATPATAAATFTVADAVGFRATDALKGAGSTITNLHGIVVADQTQGVNNYGITSQVSAGTNKRNLNITGTADNYLAGKLGLNTTNIPDSLSINGNITLGFQGSPMLRQSTNDGSDDARIQLCGGGAAGAARGAYINIHGNEHATHPGMCDLLAGDTASGGSVRLYTAGNILRLEVTRTGTVRPGADNTQSLGEASFRWSAVHTNDLTATGNTTLGDSSSDTVTVNGVMGVGGATTQANGIRVSSSALTSAYQDGVYVTHTGSAEAVSGIRSLVTIPRTAAATFTVSDVAGLWAANATKGAGSTITNLHGVFVADQTQGINNYGITLQVSAGPNKRNINAIGTADNVLMGNTGVGTSSPVARLDVVGGATGAETVVGILRSNFTANGTGTVLRLTNSTTALTNVGSVELAAVRTNAAFTGDTDAIIRSCNSAGVMTDRMKFTSTGVVDVLSGQIKFPATQNASADANTLDDYEEGTFTPTIVGTTTAGTGTYTVQVGRYQKVGDKVSFSLHLAWSAHTGTGFMRIANMPFLSKAESNLFSAVAIRHTGLSLAANSIAQGYVPTSSTQILFTQVTTGGGDAAGIDIDTSATLLVSGHYFV